MKNYVLIQGLGLNKGGVGAARYFAEHGKNVVVTDLRNEDILAPSIKELEGFKNIEYVLGEHRKKDFENAEIVIASPAVSPTNEFVLVAKKKGIPIYTEISYFFSKKRCTVVGITGTRGKSTTTNLIYKILRRFRKNVFLSGNIGISAIDLLDKTNEDSLVVIELSSFVLEWLREIGISPEYAVVTNILVDHLNRHKTMKEYIDVKKAIFKFQNKRGVLVTNIDNKHTSKFQNEARGKVITYGIRGDNADYKIMESEVYYKGMRLFDISTLASPEFHPLSGEHNLYNILATVALVREFGVGIDIIRDSIKRYEGLYGRQMYVGRVHGIDVINDTCATVPDAVIAALKRFSKRKIVLITGGTDKELNYEEFARYIKDNKIVYTVVLGGSASKKIVAELKKVKYDSSRYTVVDTLDKAVTKAFEVAKKGGDLLLFSPGAASFELFANEFDRGEKFDKIIKNLEKHLSLSDNTDK